MEPRRMMAGDVSLIDGGATLNIRGTEWADTATVKMNAAGKIEVVTSFADIREFNPAGITKIVFTGLGGGDTLNAASMSVRIEADGGAGNDILRGGRLADRLDGGLNDDTLTGNGGHDVLLGGDHKDQLDGGAGEDVLQGGSGNDTLKGGADPDSLQGDAGDDKLFGNGGADWLWGGDDADTLDGGMDGKRDILEAAGDGSRDTFHNYYGHYYLPLPGYPLPIAIRFEEDRIDHAAGSEDQVIWTRIP